MYFIHFKTFKELMSFIFHSNFDSFSQREPKVQKMDSFYTGLLEWDFIKIINTCLNIFLIFVGPCLLYSVIWYERFSADLIYRTLINQLLSHLCFIEIASCLLTRIAYFANYCFGPWSYAICDVNIFFGHYTFTVMVNQITIRQLIKYLYIFNWRNIVGLNDDFFACFITIVNLYFSFFFVFVSYFLGFHNEEPDYHICTGRTPAENVMLTMKQIRHPNPFNMTTSTEWIKDGYGTDPLEFYSKYCCLTLLLLVVQTWFYPYVKQASKCCAKVCRSLRKKTSSEETDSAIQQLPSFHNEKFEETKSNILGTSQTVLMLVLAIVAVAPISIGKALIKKNINDINSGKGRALMYLGKISMPTFTFLLFPLLMLAFNHKVRKSLWRELKETGTGKWICC